MQANCITRDISEISIRGLICQSSGKSVEICAARALSRAANGPRPTANFASLFNLICATQSACEKCASLLPPVDGYLRCPALITRGVRACGGTTERYSNSNPQWLAA